jgi:hypothetical protein
MRIAFVLALLAACGGKGPGSQPPPKTALDYCPDECCQSTCCPYSACAFYYDCRPTAACETVAEYLQPGSEFAACSDEWVAAQVSVCHPQNSSGCVGMPCKPRPYKP